MGFVHRRHVRQSSSHGGRPVTIYAYDTEFLEDGETIELISIGIACEDGREYYAVNADFRMERITGEPKREWLIRNVLPHLPISSRHQLDEYIAHQANLYPKPSMKFVALDREDTLVKPKWVIANEVRDFLLATVVPAVPSDVDGVDGEPAHGFPELWAYYAAYDHVALAQLWGPMSKLPAGIPMFTNDLMQLISHMNLGAFPGTQLPAQAGDEHHALADARWNLDVLAAFGIVGSRAQLMGVSQ